LEGSLKKRTGNVGAGLFTRGPASESSHDSSGPRRPPLPPARPPRAISVSLVWCGIAMIIYFTCGELLENPVGSFGIER
jgi:hypothetical protein